MSVTINRVVTCDGCNKEIKDYQNVLYKVSLADAENTDNDFGCQFHDYNCVKLWADKKQKELEATYTLAEAHKLLHKTIDDAGIDKNAFQTNITPEGEAGEPLEVLSLKQTNKAIEDIKAGKMDDLKIEEAK